MALETDEMTPATFAPASARPKPDLPEIGAPGTRFFGGFIVTEEYVPELLGLRGLDVFEKMRRSDGMVAAALRSIKLPLLAAKWEILAASNDPEDLKIADEVRANLFERIGWQEHLREVLTYLDFGYATFEKVWEYDGALVVLKKLAPRMQRTIYLWNTAADGGLISVKHQKWLNGSMTPVDIPIEKLLIFTNEKEGGNYTGRSALRPAYKHWYIKDQLYRIQAIAAERHGVGIPVMEMAEGKSDDPNLKRAEDILMAVRANEQGYVVTPDGYKFRIEGMGNGRVMDVDPMIKHHDWMISVSMVTQFLTLGSQETGARALSTDLTSLFLMGLQALGDYAADIHNRYLIPQLVNFNHAGVKRYPKLAVSSIESRNIGQLIAVLAQAAAAGLITGDPVVQNAIRAFAGIPPIDNAAILPAPQPTDPESDEPKAGVPPSDVGPSDVGQGGSES